jgi:hypothetical protein
MVSTKDVKCLLIGVGGYPGAGKDESILKVLGTNYLLRRDKFAFPIQDLVAELGGIETFDNSHRNLFENREWKETYPLLTIDGKIWTPRKALQKIGQGFRKMFGNNIWVNKAIQSASLYPREAICYFTDMRYATEFEMIKKAGGITVFIDRPSAEEAALSNPVFAHESEAFVPELKHRCDIVIDNSRGMEEYLWQISELASLLTVNNGEGRLVRNAMLQAQLVKTFNKNVEYYLKSVDKNE